MNKGIVLAAAALLAGSMPSDAQTMIGKSNIQLQSDCMTPEALWAMGRIGGCAASPDGKKIAYQVGYYSVKENKGHQMLYVMDADGKNQRQLTQTAKSETDVAWIEGGKRLAFLCGGQMGIISRIIYALVGLAGIWCITLLFRGEERTGHSPHTAS